MRIADSLGSLRERIKRFVHSRKISYGLVFGPKTPDHVAVLKDLAAFCRAHETTFHPDPRIHAILEGRREVWLRIQNHLQLTPEQLYALFSGKENT